jgi:hypothetical protein
VPRTCARTRRRAPRCSCASACSYTFKSFLKAESFSRDY